MPSIEWKPVTAQEVSQLLTDNFSGARLPVRVTGGATSLSHEAENPPGVLLRTDGLQRVVDYPARDMTITVEAGMTIAALQRHLESERQQLPIDIPQPELTTIGGAIACNISGPGRYGFGTFRDYLLGISAVDGQGRLFSAGGRVVKNVAGYDLCKLMIGSRGTLAAITQVTLKLVPQARSRQWVLTGSDDLETIENALQRLNLSATRPVAIELLNAESVARMKSVPAIEFPSAPYLLCIGFAGTLAETSWQAETVCSELQPFSLSPFTQLQGEPAQQLWDALTEFPVSAPEETTLRVSVLPSQLISTIHKLAGQGIALQAHAGNGILTGHFTSRAAVDSNKSLLDAVKMTAQSTQGMFALSQGGSFAPLAGVDSKTPAAALMRQLKETFDPAGIFPAV